MSLPTNFFIGRGGKRDPNVFSSISMGTLEFTHLDGTHHDSASVKDIIFSTDGMKCFLFPYSTTSTARVSQLNLSTAWDMRNPISRTSFTTFSNDGNFGQQWNFSSDGMHLLAGSRSEVKHYALSNPYDLTGLTRLGYTGILSTTVAQGCGYSTDGSLFWNYNRGGDDLRVWNLPTPYHLSGATQNSGYTQSGVQLGSAVGGGNIYGVHMSADGECIAVIDSFVSDSVYFSSLSTPYDFGTLSNRTAASYTNPSSGTSQMALAVTPKFVYTCDEYNLGKVRQFNATVR